MRLNNKGISFIGVIVVLAAVTFALYQKSDVLFKLAVNKQSTNELNISGKIFSSGMFNYTVFAIKERWCMDSKWGKDKACSTTSDMDKAISNPLNLERLLWATSTVNDITDRYFKQYKKLPAISPLLSKVSQKISISDLDSLGTNHPLNIIINDNVRRCIDSVTVNIERQNASILKPQGDEVYLIISIVGNGNFDLFSKCTQIKKTLNLKGLVVFYPRTLNQFALIKTQNLDIDSLNSVGGKGVSFNGPVYVQGDLLMTSGKTNKLAFRDIVKLGEGVLKRDGAAYTPSTYGNPKDFFLNQISSLDGFFGGVGLDAEIDGGLSKLFLDAYKYPSNTNMADCTNREKLKNEFSLTKDSRLFFSGSNGVYKMGLTFDNEFREYKILGAGTEGFFIRNINDPQVAGDNGTPKYSSYSPSQFGINYKARTPTDYPVMEMNLTLETNGGTNNSQELNYSRILMGRTSEVQIELADKAFYADQSTKVDTGKDHYLDLSKTDYLKWGPESATKQLLTLYDNLKNVCDNNIFNTGNFVGYDGCGRVLDKPGAIVINCDTAFSNPGDQSKCKSAVKAIQDPATEYLAEEGKIISALKELSTSPPTINVKTDPVLSNKENIGFYLNNESTLNNIFLQHIESINFRINAFDFAIENSPSNTVSGLRKKKTMLPGPNEIGADKENKFNLKVIRDHAQAFKKIEMNTGDGQLFEDKLKKSPSGWAMLKKDNKSNTNPEPPGNDWLSATPITYPTDGLTIEQAKKLDEECKVDIAAATPPSWDVSFTDTTQFSWLYNLTSSGITITDPSKTKPLPNYTFDISNNDMTVGFYSGIPTRSIVENCYIKSNIDFVFGFYVCQSLIIEGRSTPLNIVGTFVVRDLKIDSSAARSGVNFYSIWQDQAIELLQAKKHLKREYLLPPSGKTDCLFPQTSGWNPKLSDDAAGDFQACSPSKFLYQGANNFNWTTIDPELGIASSAGTQATTQSKIVNRYRRFGINVIWQKEDAQ